MSQRLYVRRGGGAASTTEVTNMVGRKGAPALDGSGAPLINMGRRAADGEASQGNFVLWDPDAEIHSTTYRLSPHALVTWTEDSSGDELWLARGRIAPLESGRPYTYTPDTLIEWDVTVNDNNMDLRGQPFTVNVDRPAETDIERVMWVHDYMLNGSSSTAPHSRSSCNITVDTDDNGHLVSTAFDRNMPARTYPAGTQPQDVIAECAERSGKTYAVVIHHTGGSSHDCLLYVGALDHATYVTDVKVSDQLDDWDPDDATAPVFEPIWDRGKGTSTENDDVVSGVVVIYGGTNDQPTSVFVHDPADELPYEYWVETINDDKVDTEDEASNLADTYFTSHRAPGHRFHRFSILMKASQHHLIAAGMSMQVKSAVIAGGADLGTYVWRRITELRWEPHPDPTLLWAHIDLEKVLRRRGHATQPKSTSPKPAPEPAPGGGETLIRHYRAGDVANDSDPVIKKTFGGSDALDNQNQGAGKAAEASTYYYNWAGGTGAASFITVACSPGDVIHVKGYTELQAKSLHFGFFSAAAGSRVGLNMATLLDNTVCYLGSQDGGTQTARYSWAPFDITATAPASTQSWGFYRTPSGTGGIDFDEIRVYNVTAAAGASDPNAVDYGDSPHESPFYLPSDYVLDRLGDLSAAIAANTATAVDTDPTSTDDADLGYLVGHLWVNTTTDDAFVLVDNTTGAAVWESITASSGDVVTLQQTQINQRFPVWGHRGDIGSADAYPEESLEGLRQCALKGIQGAEIDVRLSSDAEWVLMHDSTVDRTTSSTGSVSSKTASTITGLTIDAGYGYDAGRHGSSIHPTTLAAVFDALNPYDFVLSIQLPSDISSDANATALAQYVLDHGWAHRSLIEVSTLTAAAAIKAVSPLLTVEVNNTVSGADSDDNVDWLSMERATVTSLSVVTGKAPKHVKSYITINDFPADETSIIQNMWDRGVSAYQTDNVDFALAARNALVYGGTFDEPTADAHISDTTDAHDASAISIVDSGGYFTGTDVEAALQEVGADLASVGSGTGVGPILISDTPSTPLIFADLIQNEAQDDLVYADL